ncbi:MAG TPA: ATP-binding protein [Acidobacteriota bacterium]|nr:ATP-binding protein [Acidobacteriota bacterium]
MDSNLQSRRRIVTLLRWVMFIALAYLVSASGDGTVALRAGLLAVVALSNVALSRLRLATWEHSALLPVIASIDIAVLLGAMVSGTGFARDFFFAYFVILAIVGMAGSLRWALVGTALSVAGYGAILGLEHGMVLLQTPSLIGRLGFLFSVGVGYGGLIEASRARMRETILQDQLLGWVGKIRATFSDDFNATDVIRQILVDVQAIYPGRVRASLVQLGEETMQVISSSDDETIRELELSEARYPELVKAVETRETIVIDDLRTDPLTASVHELVADLPFTALLLCPVNLQDPTIGDVVLRVARRGGTFSPSLVDTTQHIAEAIGAIFRQAKMHEAMQRTEKMEMVSQIAVSVSHSFNEILSTVLLAAESLRKQADRHAASAGSDGPFDEQSMARFETIELSVKEGLTIVERLASWTQLESDDGQEASATVIDSRGVLEEAWKYARPRWARREATRGLSLRLNVEEARAVEGSSPELREVLLNLIHNAIDAMPRGGTMTLGLTEVDDKVVFSVEDTGTGMSEEILERIFEPLFTTKGSAGTGLGLSNARSVAQRHDGMLSAESQEGVGSRFCLILPASSMTPSDTQGATVDDETAATGGQRVLLVEANDLVRDVMLRVLQGAGLDVDVVASLDEAEVMLGTHRAYSGLVIDAAIGAADLPEFLPAVQRADADLAGRVLLYSNGDMTAGMIELQQTFGVSCVDRSAGLATLSDALSAITARDSAAA